MVGADLCERWVTKHLEIGAEKDTPRNCEVGFCYPGIDEGLDGNAVRDYVH